MLLLSLSLAALVACSAGSQSPAAPIDRRKVVQSFNPRRNTSSALTPLQVGNGNFAFGVDVTGLQTFQPFGTLSTWGWHNFSLPTTPNQTSITDFTGLDWWTHGRLVNYDQPNPAEDDISTWLIKNPHRLNLATVGFSFNGVNVDESQLQQKAQELDIWSGKISSAFSYNGSLVKVETWAHPGEDSVGIKVESDLLTSGSLGLFVDFPYPTPDKFSSPFVGVLNATSLHRTDLGLAGNAATIQHSLDATKYAVTFQWETESKASRSSPSSHKYIFLPATTTNTTQVVINFANTKPAKIADFAEASIASQKWWESYWSSGAFVDLSSVSSPIATELHRRTVLSQYLVAVNSASSNPPQESGLVNNGWYGKFHLEMYLWHTLPFARWNQFPLFWRSTPNTYARFLQSSRDRAAAQGYAGARWGKMTDPAGRSAPGEINSLLIWQQPHPMFFAETEWRAFPNDSTLARWDEVLTATADFMASYAWRNDTGKAGGPAAFQYDLGPPMYPVSENTNPNATRNPAFELAYWRFGLDVALRWKSRLNATAPPLWTTVRDHLAPLPTAPDPASPGDSTFAIYEGVPDMWTDPATVFDHPAVAFLGLLPPPYSGPPLDLRVANATARAIRRAWRLDQSFGWDFPLLAMNALRLGDAGGCVDYLLHPAFQFDDAGYPLGGDRVATPYFPGSSSLLLAVAMMAGGWDGAEGPHFPAGWEDARVEGFSPAL